MEKRGLNELRELFFTFFESKGHLRLPSFSLVPQNDPSILLINAGMTPMKPWFKGEEEPPRRRVCTCQRCVRTPDIDNVGKDDRHGTFFEMLGNFSFGDYFKEDAIAWSWEFLTQVLGMDPDRLYPSVYLEDDEAFDIWNKKVGIPKERIYRFGKEDNFWEHGAGPCGPCSEIYYDRGPEYSCGKPDCTVGCDCDRYMEVWNNVFSQFDNDGQGHYIELKQKNIDTGMGLERLACVVQGVSSIFEVDTLRRVLDSVSRITGVAYGSDGKTDVSLRVITDHLRAATFMINDGILPSNEGRGYVLRRMLRRAARHGKLLGMDQPFLHQVVETIIAENCGHEAELKERQDYIIRVVRVEEENFAKTLDGGLRIFHDMLEACRQKGETRFLGADAFKLYDTYGFPVDLTQEMAAEFSLEVDTEAFEKLMQEQKARAREARKALGDLGWTGVEFGKEIPETRFVGYDRTRAQAKVLAIVAEEEQREEIAAGAEAILVLDQTPFYAEMGGQVADHGFIRKGDAVFQVNDVQKNKGGKFMHTGRVISGQLRVGDQVEAEIDASRRQAIARAHSATHMLDAALKKVLGDHVHQAGSLVEPDRLRFDFTHFEAVNPDQMNEISRMVNEQILRGLPVVTEVLPLAEAKKKGAIAVFGEKYGDTVRVVEMGDFSMELCGGTHLDNIAKVGVFHVDGEFSVAAGVRRIEATTGLVTLQTLNRNQELLFQAASSLKVRPGDLREKISQVNLEMRSLRQALEKLQAKEAAGETERFLLGGHSVGELHTLTATIPEADANKLRQMGDLLRDKKPNVVGVLSSVNGEKITFLAVCGKEAVAKGIKAGDLVKLVSGICGGKGGGKPDSAMGGGSDLLKLDDALAAVDDFVAEKLGK